MLLYEALTPVPAGAKGALVALTSGAYTLPSGYLAALVNYTARATTIYGSGSANESILAGNGGLLFGAYGAGTVVAGDGTDDVYIPASAGPWNVQLGNGNNAVLALGGNDTLSGGTGTNLFYLGAGASSVLTHGADTVAGGSGTSTVVASTAGLQNVANSNGVLVFAGSGGIDFTGNAGASTVIGLAGSITVNGGDGGGLFFGGTAGNNLITTGNGNATIFGGGSGDVLTSNSTDLVGCGAGAETVIANGHTTKALFAGTGPDYIRGGLGTNALVAGTENDTLVAVDRSDLNLFVFTAGRTGGNDLVQGFVAGRDFVAIQGFQGYPTGTVSYLLANATTANGAETLRLPDGTQVTFAGVTNLAAESFV